MLSIMRNPEIALQHNENVLSAAKKRKHKRGHAKEENTKKQEANSAEEVGHELLKWQRRAFDVGHYQVNGVGGPRWRDVVLRLVVDLDTSKGFVTMT